MLRALVYIVPVALAVYALIDFSRSQASDRSGLPTPAWVAVIILVPVLGPIIWLVLSRRTVAGGTRTSGTGTGPGPAPRRPRRSGPVAPDDDPDFLWRLEQEQRRRRRAGGQPGGGPADGSSGPTSDDEGDEGGSRPSGPAGPAPEDGSEDDPDDEAGSARP